MICRKCGKNNANDSQFCYYCGGKLISTETWQEDKYHNVGKKKTGTILVVSILIIAILTATVIGLLLYINRETNSASEPVRVERKASQTEGKRDSKATTNPSAQPTVTPTEVPQNTTTLVYNAKLEQKDIYLRRADEIERYAQLNLDTANTQHQLNTESGIVFTKWDGLLNEVYQYLKTIMTESDFKQLEKEELDWIYRKENAIQAEGEKWGNGSGGPLAKNSVGIQYTKERCYYLIHLIR